MLWCTVRETSNINVCSFKQTDVLCPSISVVPIAVFVCNFINTGHCGTSAVRLSYRNTPLRDMWWVQVNLHAFPYLWPSLSYRCVSALTHWSGTRSRSAVGDTGRYCRMLPGIYNLIILFINCNWVVTRWQWLFYMYTNMKKN